MKKTAVMTDSNSGITPEEGEQAGIYILPMPVIIDGTTYYENVDITEAQFYEKQASGSEVTSSQPSLEALLEMWTKLLEEYEEIVYIPMSSGLSGSCQSAAGFAGEFDGRVQVVDNCRISVTQLQSVYDAKKLADQGMSAAAIREILEKEALDATIYISVDTLEYLKKGGRVTPAAAALGSILHIKPVMTIQGGKLDAYTKVRGTKAAFRAMCKALRHDLETRLKTLHDSGELVLGMAYTHLPPEEVAHWKEEMAKEFPGETILTGHLMMSIGCHTGPGALAMGAVRKK